MGRKRLHGAVVTGAGSGLGRALALEAAREGAAVVVSDVDAEGAAETVARIQASGGRAWFVACDVRDPEAVAALLTAALEHVGTLDLWVNNAGVAVVGRSGHVPLDDWRWVVDVNLWGMIHGCEVVVPHFLAQGRGHVLNVSSAAGLLSAPEMGPYNVSKAGVVSLTETIFAELVGTGVSATVVCPTFFQTNLMDTARSPDVEHVRLGRKLMERSRVTADDVARRALRDAQRGRLYSVAMADGRWLWRLKRLAPQFYYQRLPAGMELLQRLVRRLS